jgi:hypothetical protein
MDERRVECVALCRDITPMVAFLMTLCGQVYPSEYNTTVHDPRRIQVEHLQLRYGLYVHQAACHWVRMNHLLLYIPDNRLQDLVVIPL